MTQFSALGLPETLLKALTDIGFTEATPIQAQAIPLAMQGRDVLGSAATGTGKTAAFSVPLIAHLMKSKTSTALVMLPTRELATQVLTTIEPLLKMERSIQTACLIGGESMPKQLKQLSNRPRVIVGTPGRINDHLMRGSLRLESADFLVLDETDRMLDMGFGIQIEKIIMKMAKKRQTLMFSATLPPQIATMSSKYLVRPERVSVGTSNKPAAKIVQRLVHTADGDKYAHLTSELNKAKDATVIVFVKTKRGADRLATRLTREDYAADAIHGDLQQRRRDRVIQGFRDKKFRILVATDVAARGLDIPHIEFVINYDLPQAPEDYIHRIGRTARNDAEGEAISLLTPADHGKWKAIARLINPGEAANLPKQKTSEMTRSEKKPYKPYTAKDGGFKKREGGFKKREGGFKQDGDFRKEGGFKKPEGGFKKRAGGFKSEGGFKKRDGDFQRPEGGFKKKEGGFKKKFASDKPAKPGFGAKKPFFKKAKPKSFKRRDAA